jgi:EpsI family protein
MQYTANFTVAMIKMAGIPVYQDGLSFILPTGSWSVVEECSGVRYLIASFSLGSIYAYLNYSSTKKRVIFILLSLIVPIVGNGLRAFGIVMIGHFSGMKLAVGADHLLYGWFFFGVIIFLLFYAGSFWRDSGESLEEINVQNRSSTGDRRNYAPLGFLLITLLLMSSTLLLSDYIWSEKQREIKPVSFQLPDNFSGWQYDASRSLNWRPVFLNPDMKITRGYFSGKDFVQLNIAYYQTQRKGAEAVSTNNKITNPYGGEWKLISATDIFESDKYFTESELIYSNEKLLVWSWYRVGKYETHNPYIAKVLEVYNLIIEGRSDASILSIATQLNGTKIITRQKLYDFWKASSKDITNNFEKIRNEK